MAPGLVAQIKEDWRHCYRARGSSMVGVIQAISPSGMIARIRLDDVADSYVLVSHLEPADRATGARPGELAGAPETALA